jgi:hypothetical protein
MATHLRATISLDDIVRLFGREDGQEARDEFEGDERRGASE